MSKFKIVAIVALSFFLFSLGLRAFGDDDPQLRRGGLTGVQEFFTSGTFIVPRDVTHVMLTMWGAGGGGGAAANGPVACQGGGLAGGGAYTNTVVQVIPGATYNVVVGEGGTGGLSQGDSGTDGGDSQFVRGNTILAFAGGGKAGASATPSSYGIGGDGGQADSSAQISHSPPGANVVGGGGSGLAAAYNLIPQNLAVNTPPLGTGGDNGGIGACGGGSNGMPGYVLLTF